MRPLPFAVADARVVRVVGDVEHAVVVQVVGIGIQERAGGRRLRLGVPGGVARQRQLAAVEVDLAREVVHRAGVVPPDARVEHGDQHVGPAGRHLPGQVDAHAAHAEELRGAGVDRRIAGLVAGELPLGAAGEVDGPDRRHGPGRRR